MACSRVRTGRRRSGRYLQAPTPEIHPGTPQPAQLPRSQPGPGEDQEDGLIVGLGVGEELAELLGRENARLDPAEDDLGINRTLGRRNLADRVRRDQPLILGPLQDAVQERTAGHDGGMLQLLAA